MRKLSINQIVTVQIIALTNIKLIFKFEPQSYMKRFKVLRVNSVML